MKYLFIIPFLLMLNSCVSNKTVEINRASLEGKSIVFSMTRDSEFVVIEKRGSYLGSSETPINSTEFRNSLIRIFREQNLNVRFSDKPESEKNYDYLITADLKEIIWEFGFSTATMTVEIEYTLEDGRKFIINGTNKSGGFIVTAKDNLFKSFINANSNFLAEFAKSQN